MNGKRQIEIYYVLFPKKNNRLLMMLFDALDSLKGAVFAVFLIFTLIFRAVGVSGSSMEPTLQDKDWLAITSIAVDLHRGDIVVVTKPWERDIPIIKRVIALPGDTIDIDFDRGEVFINGELQNEPYIAEPTHLQYNANLPLTVLEGYLFVMGDNRNDSLDSRSSKVGLIENRYVLGRAFVRFYPNTQRLERLVK